jgi:hypothetical protein
MAHFALWEGTWKQPASTTRSREEIRMFALVALIGLVVMIIGFVRHDRPLVYRSALVVAIFNGIGTAVDFSVGAPTAFMDLCITAGAVWAAIANRPAPAAPVAPQPAATTEPATEGVAK